MIRAAKRGAKHRVHNLQGADYKSHNVLASLGLVESRVDATNARGFAGGLMEKALQSHVAGPHLRCGANERDRERETWWVVRVGWSRLPSPLGSIESDEEKPSSELHEASASERRLFSLCVNARVWYLCISFQLMGPIIDLASRRPSNSLMMIDSSNARNILHHASLSTPTLLTDTCSDIHTYTAQPAQTNGAPSSSHHHLDRGH